MAMKPVAIFIVVAAFSVATIAATARTVTTTAGTNDRMVEGVAGPVAAANASQHKMKLQAKNAKTKPRMAAAKPKPPVVITD
jgi:hypothetical protein